MPTSMQKGLVSSSSSVHHGVSADIRNGNPYMQAGQPGEIMFVDRKKIESELGGGFAAP
jgi:hypothetical protein